MLFLIVLKAIIKLPEGVFIIISAYIYINAFKWIYVRLKRLTLFGKLRAALVTFDLVMVLLLLSLYGRTGKKNIAYTGENYITYIGKMNTAVEAEGIMDAAGDINGSESLLIEESHTEKKKVALTFDDGPHYAYTKVLLDGLRERGVVATFFVTGEHAALHPDLVERMHNEGHLVGNHTYSHMALRRDNREEYKEELILTSEVLEEITGEEVIFVRPPYGSWDKSFEEELNMIPVLWTVDPLDWCSSSAECIVRNTMCKVKENDIILMHDYYETSVAAALTIVDKLVEDGFTFVTVEDILFE